MIVRTITAIILLLALPGGLLGQDPPDPCGELENKPGVLDRVARYFQDPDHATVLANMGLEQPGRDAAREVITDRRSCAQLMGLVRGRLGRSGIMKRLQPTGFDFVVLRYGHLVAVPVIQRPPKEDFLAHPYTEIFVFDAQSRSYLGSIVE